MLFIKSTYIARVIIKNFYMYKKLYFFSFKPFRFHFCFKHIVYYKYSIFSQTNSHKSNHQNHLSTSHIFANISHQMYELCISEFSSHFLRTVLILQLLGPLLQVFTITIQVVKGIYFII